MKKSKKLFWGLIFILAAVLLVIDALGTEIGFLNGIPVVKTLIVLLLVSIAVEEICKRDFGSFFFLLAISFMIYEKQIAKWLSLENENIISNWIVLLVALLLTVGCHLLFGKKRNVSYKDNTNNSKHKVAGSSVTNIDCSDFTEARISNELGSCEVHFSNVESYTGNGVLTVENELGCIKIYVPDEWTVTNRISNELGSVRVEGSPKPDGKTLIINGSNELGTTFIIYVQ